MIGNSIMHKGGSGSVPGAYHPISVVPVVAKVFEKMWPSNCTLTLKILSALVLSRGLIIEVSLPSSCFWLLWIASPRLWTVDSLLVCFLGFT